MLTVPTFVHFDESANHNAAGLLIEGLTTPFTSRIAAVSNSLSTQTDRPDEPSASFSTREGDGCSEP